MVMCVTKERIRSKNKVSSLLVVFNTVLIELSQSPHVSYSLLDAQPPQVPVQPLPIHAHLGRPVTAAASICLMAALQVKLLPTHSGVHGKSANSSVVKLDRDGTGTPHVLRQYPETKVLCL